MTQKHTPEPWDYVHEHGAWEGYHEPDSGEFEITFRAKTEKDAARIVACVNAMAGIEDPEKWVKDQKEYREEMANSSLSAEVQKRLVLKEERNAAMKMGITITNQRNKLLAFVRKVDELGYTHGDQDNDASKAMFELYEEASELLKQYDPS